MVMQYGEFTATPVTSFRYGMAGLSRPAAPCYEEADPFTAFVAPPRATYEEADPSIDDRQQPDPMADGGPSLFFITSAQDDAAERQLIGSLAAPFYLMARENA